jgi:hypothetical protein
METDFDSCSHTSSCVRPPTFSPRLRRLAEWPWESHALVRRTPLLLDGPGFAFRLHVAYVAGAVTQDCADEERCNEYCLNDVDGDFAHSSP